ncbi:RagB/SusD family nutrient uptake outer membrane protein [Cellulophaga sp. F20128]|uniref:RagB/SusD family nutrient uptake outer membrane protein n=1 Tax=Cellulophaga sp. F20128 TaxID=2926413 RepID=UPI001FF33EF6|nr:RagB/SusD family nutrient uptake outer membrane protein [Cellulophaga sp. F20128]MCK0158292.1 RagB/SusD family nutrient uptake outer membrane protein [Cellulophaga sp. F20128]
MKKYIIIAFITLISFSCSDYLDVIPDNIATLDLAFQDRTTTLRYLATCYSYMPSFQNIRNNPAQSGSDEFYIDPNSFYGNEANRRGVLMRNGLQTAEDPYFDQWNSMYDAIRDCNTFLERAPGVSADLPDFEKRQWIAEVKFLKAFYHFQLMKLYGAVPTVKENLSVEAGIEQTRISREPFDSSVEYLVGLLDEAIEDLPAEIINLSIEAGHITKVIAATVKAEMLITAASPLYNGNSDINFLKNNDGTALYSDSFDQNKWSVAATASKQALDLALSAGHSFYEITQYPNISDSTRIVLNRKQCVMEQWNSEIIFATNRYNTANVETVTPYFSQSQHTWAPYNTYIAPSFETTNFFYSSNGVPIDEDNSYPYEQRHNVVLVPQEEKFYALPNYETMQINLSREPRYYSNLAFDGSRWFGNGKTKDINEGANANDESYVFKMKEGQEQGKNGNLRFSPTGLYCRKLVHINSVYSSSSQSRTERNATFAIYRLAELYLFYAEALNESLEAPNQEVYNAIDAVRQVAGLKGVVESWTNFSKFPDKVTNKEGMRDIIRHERTAEFAFEGKRYFDIRRWKTASEPMNKPIQGLNVTSDITSEFNQIIAIEQQKFFGRDYFLPIEVLNLRTNKNLVQNPMW